HAVGQQLALRRKFVRQAIKDEVEVEFSGDGDVKTWHVSGHYRRCGLGRVATQSAATELRGFTRIKLKMVDPERLELPTPAFEAQCSIQLSYGSSALSDLRLNIVVQRADLRPSKAGLA